ncbi:hypothetical protein [Microbacterium resistens]|uniref:hypothetical protein n=1 Tax=Microbacterium resistens TaxID=156977 RepID=UPI003672EA7C
MEPTAFTLLYGRWAPRTPHDVVALFEGYPGAWWISGGWALEAFTGVARAHADIDPSVLRAELPLLRAHLRGRLHVWAAFGGALRPLAAEDRPEADPDAVLPDGCGQVWTRASADDPWEYDILLVPGTRDEWRYHRDETIRLPLADALWERDSVRYLQPEIQLLSKAKALRDKDAADFEATLPFLDSRRRDWLRSALRRTLPDHPWITRLS